MKDDKKECLFEALVKNKMLVYQLRDLAVSLGREEYANALHEIANTLYDTCQEAIHTYSFKTSAS